MDKQKKYSTIFIVITIFVFFAALVASSYAFFTYNKEVAVSDLTSGEISINISNIASDINLDNVEPTDDTSGKALTNYIDFEVVGTTDDLDVLYNLDIVPKNTNTLDGKYVKLYLTDQDNNEVVAPILYSDLIAATKNNGNTIYSGRFAANNDGTRKTDTHKYRLRVWLDESYEEPESQTFDFDIYTYSYNGNISASNKVIRAINKHATGTCQNITYVEDGITYFSGTNDCINFNYVWYSGKLWRITAIYPDGTMKLVTEDALTSIFWGSTVDYDGSWVYQWLNEDFYDTLVNPNYIIISNATWNYSTDGNSIPVKPETIATQKTKTAPIGLLNAYEYYNAYRNVSASTNYLNIGYCWWLITPYSTSLVRRVNNPGNLYNISPSGYAYGVRPSVNLKSGLEFTGVGTRDDPYKIKGDMEGPINNVTLLSSRSIGEYVNFDNDIYRIVDIDETNGETKLTRVDYLRDNGTVIKKNFASSVYFGNSTNTQEDTFWDYFLNNNWYNSISSTYKNMLIDGTYYLGLYPSSTNYKATVCKDATLDNVTTKNCTKYTSSDTDKTFTGKVGLPRVGEMFTAQLGSGYNTSSDIWTITPYSTSDVRSVDASVSLENYSPLRRTFGARPSINLKSGIKITGGTGYVGGDTNSPFEISE